MTLFYITATILTYLALVYVVVTRGLAGGELRVKRQVQRLVSAILGGKNDKARID